LEIKLATCLKTLPLLVCLALTENFIKVAIAEVESETKNKSDKSGNKETTLLIANLIA